MHTKDILINSDAHGRARAASGSESGRQALGNNAKSSAKFSETICKKTGEIQQLTVNNHTGLVSIKSEPFEHRSHRFSLQRVAALSMSGHQLPSGKPYRVTKCLWTNHSDYISVLKSKEFDSAHFGNLVTCGSVWSCPICSAKICERRKLEISSAIDKHHEAGGASYMITFTFPHQKTDKLTDLLINFKSALTFLREQRKYKDLLTDIDYIGMIRALEVKYGKNGWHPHTHELFMTSKPIPARVFTGLKKRLFNIWSKACSNSGLEAPSYRHGVDIRRALSPAEYVAKFGTESKWGIGSELTKLNFKTKPDGSTSYTPWELLTMAGNGCTNSRSKFVEFAKAFHGSRQLYWTNGLKALFQIGELTDDEIAAQQDNPAELISKIPVDLWKKVLRSPYDARPVILRLAETGGNDAVELFLSGFS